MQKCIKCETEKSESDFHKNSRTKSGYASVCAECDNLRKRERYEDEGEKAHKKAYREANAEKNIAYQDEYREANKDTLLAKRRLNVDHKRELDYTYSQANPDKIVAKSAKRRAVKVKATVSWATPAYIAMFYQMAKDEEIRTGRKVEVDHIVPLNSELVCGLHCEDNLQLLFKEDNAIKGNRTWPNMWEPLDPTLG